MWKCRYADITSLSLAGRVVIDYSLFHEIEPDEAADEPQQLQMGD